MQQGDVAQVPYNLLNPSAGRPIPTGFPAQDFRGLLDVARRTGRGVIGIRVLAGGALSGSEARHPLGMSKVDPIGSGEDYATDVRRAQAFAALAGEAGLSGPIELAIRCVISHSGMSTAMVGLSTLEQLETAAAAAERGTLPQDLLQRIAAVQDGFVGKSA